MISSARFSILILLILGGALTSSAHGEPIWQGKGRIAISSDGNEHDHDDWAATPLSLAILASQGLQDSLVLYTYSDHVWGNGGFGGRGYREMERSALEGKRIFGFDKSRFMAAVDDPEAAYQAMAEAINVSSKEDPLFIVAAGPMQVVGEGIQKSQISKRQFITVISHSKWNNEHSDKPGPKEQPHAGWTFEEMQTAFATAAGGSVKFVQILDQNGGKDYRGLNTDRVTFDWIKTSPARKHMAYQPGAWDWLYSRLETCLKNEQKNFDPSDAGMIVYLLTGIQKTDPENVRELMEHPVEKRLSGN